MSNANILNGWKRLDDLFLPRAVQAVVASDRFIYQAGGHRGTMAIAPANYTADVEAARVNPDGSLQPWKVVGTLPRIRGNCGGIVSNGYLYIVGGDHATDVFQNNMWYAKTAPDGSLSPFLLTNFIHEHVIGAQLAVSKGYLYCVGGTNPATRNIWASKLNSDGSLLAWKKVGALPFDGMAHCALVEKDGYLFVIGGLVDGSTPVQGIYSARVEPDGSLSQLKQVGSLTSPRWRHSAVVVGNTLFIVGGSTGVLAATSVDTVEAIHFDTAGSVRATQLISRLPKLSRNARIVALADRIYAIGGSDTANLAHAAVQVYNAQW